MPKPEWLLTLRAMGGRRTQIENINVQLLLLLDVTTVLLTQQLRTLLMPLVLQHYRQAQNNHVQEAPYTSSQYEQENKPVNGVLQQL